MQLIRQFMRDNKITSIYISENCGYSQQHVSRVLNGHRKITNKFFKLLCFALIAHDNCNEEKTKFIQELLCQHNLSS